MILCCAGTYNPQTETAIQHGIHTEELEKETARKVQAESSAKEVHLGLLSMCYFFSPDDGSKGGRGGGSEGGVVGLRGGGGREGRRWE